MQRAAAHATRKIGRSKTRAALVENLWKQMRIPVRSAVLYTVTSVDGRPSPSRAGSQNVYPGGIEVPKLGCVSSHGYPSTPAICPLQTRLARNGHVATYFAACGQCRASHSWSPKMGSNSGPRLFAIIVSPLQVLTSIRRLSTRSRAYGCKPSTRRVADSQELNSLPRRLTCPSRLSISCNAPGLRHRGTYWCPSQTPADFHQLVAGYQSERGIPDRNPREFQRRPVQE